MQSCSYPNCGHSGDIVTNHHCLSQHGMTKRSVIEQYGVFKESPYNVLLNKEIEQWINQETHLISESDFTYSSQRGMLATSH